MTTAPSSHHSEDTARAHRLLAEAGPTVSIPETATVLGISRGLAYQLAASGELGVKVLRLGARWRVSTASLREALGITSAAA